MRVVRDLATIEPAGAGRAVTIGVFDGVHLGHRALLRLVRELAAVRGLESGVVTFDRHPAELVRPGSEPKLLTTLDQKLELLAATGLVDICVVLTFDESRRLEPADEFVREVLVGALRTRLVVVGADFHFGHRRSGNVPFLETIGAELGFEVLGLGLVATPDGDRAAAGTPPYSSTRVRGALAEGDVEAASAMLGRMHEVVGRVEHGDARGRELGFPTANVAVRSALCLPADGVYAGTFVDADGVERQAALSVGRRPTFYEEGGLRLLEAYLLDFDGDLYDQEVRVRFAARIRGQQRFESADALVARMTLDVAAARDALRSAFPIG
jgi:riboflavin kinase/FMN adenylyltransferase